MNGIKGPNQVGKDIGFVGSFYNNYETTAVAVLPYKEDRAMSELEVINNNYLSAAATFCNTLHDDDWTLPDVNELSLMYLNYSLIFGNEHGLYYISSTPSVRFTGAKYATAADVFNVDFGAYSNEGVRVGDAMCTMASHGPSGCSGRDSYVRCVRKTALK